MHTRWEGFYVAAPEAAAAGAPLDGLRPATSTSLGDGRIAMFFPAPRGAELRDAQAAAQDLRAALGPDAVVEPQFEVDTGLRAALDLEGGVAPEPPPDDLRWHLELLGVTEAWEAVPGRGAGVRVGHPDTGTTDHAAIRGAPSRVLDDLGYDYYDGDRIPRDGMAGPFAGHGTKTSSVIVGDWETPRGRIEGVAPRAELVPLRVSPSVVVFAQWRLAFAIHHAIDARCDVVSISMGGPPSQALEDAVARAARAGVIVVAAAGNYVGAVAWPARYPDAVAVAACGPTRAVWRHSCRGDEVDITAPGHLVWVPGFDSGGADPTSGSGTSYATATTAGGAALWLARHDPQHLRARYPGRALVRAFRSIAQRTSRALPPDSPDGFGAGVLDVGRLVGAPLPDPNDLGLLTDPAPVT